jgi:regulator of nonsense transcripts 2
VLESIRVGLESPSSGTYQKRMADVRLLGELYNYMLCNRWAVQETTQFAGAPVTSNCLKA